MPVERCTVHVFVGFGILDPEPDTPMVKFNWSLHYQRGSGVTLTLFFMIPNLEEVYRGWFHCLASDVISKDAYPPKE